jgi:thiosulfate/3-mercaptopyruvate sulfurtransferase
MAGSNVLIDVDTLSSQLQSVRVVDCSHDLERTEAGVNAYRAGHIPGAVHAHLDRDLSGKKTGMNGRHPLPAPDALIRWLGQSGIDSTTPVVAYDRSGGAYAARLWWLLRWIGHRDVRVLDGGWQAWVEAGVPAHEGTVTAPAVSYAAPEVADELGVDTAFVMRNLTSREALIVDARGASRYTGATEPIDPRAGHIPGAINRPYTDNLDERGRFKSSATLASEWAHTLNGRPSDEVIAQCGSGVTACHNLMAMEIAGMRSARLYPGSWSEWCSDPLRPVETHLASS